MPILEFALDPADVRSLLQRPGLRAARSFPITITWHDTPEGALAEAGLALSVAQGAWRLAPLRPTTASTVPESQPSVRRPSLLDLSSFGVTPAQLAPQASFTGRRQAARYTNADAVALHLLDGEIDHHPACRLTLEGEPDAITALALALTPDVGLHVPRASLAAEALSHASQKPPPPRALGAPLVHEGQSVSESLAGIVSHLLDVMLHWASLIPAQASPDPEPVHQMRVATRRLRSALSLYAKAAPCPDLDAIVAPLRHCAARLGDARDWDVFIGGLGARLAAAFPDDKRCRALMRAAAARRAAAYTELRTFLASPEFRTLAAALSCAATLRPWDATAPAESVHQDTATLAAALLTRRAKRVRHAGRGIESMPIPALHELRKDCKRLRYASEFFSPLFRAKRTRRFVAALADLQEELGLLNDSAAVSGLMAQLGRLERSYAAGLVEGFSAAHAGPARNRIECAWKRFRAADPFWQH